MRRNLVVHQLTQAGSLQGCGTEILYLLAFLSLAVFPGKQAKRQQYQRFADVPISVFEICMTQINKTGPVSNFSCRLLYCIALRMCTKIPLSFSLNKL